MICLFSVYSEIKRNSIEIGIFVQFLTALLLLSFSIDCGHGNHVHRWCVRFHFGIQQNRGGKPDIGWSDTILW